MADKGSNIRFLCEIYRKETRWLQKSGLLFVENVRSSQQWLSSRMSSVNTQRTRSEYRQTVDEIDEELPCARGEGIRA
jgi:hypothetical protein